MRILLVEDDPSTSRSIDLMLTHADIGRQLAGTPKSRRNKTIYLRLRIEEYAFSHMTFLLGQNPDLNSVYKAQNQKQD